MKILIILILLERVRKLTFSPKLSYLKFDFLVHLNEL